MSKTNQSPSGIELKMPESFITLSAAVKGVRTSAPFEKGLGDVITTKLTNDEEERIIEEAGRIGAKAYKTFQKFTKLFDSKNKGDIGSDELKNVDGNLVPDVSFSKKRVDLLKSMKEGSDKFERAMTKVFGDTVDLEALKDLELQTTKLEGIIKSQEK